MTTRMATKRGEVAVERPALQVLWAETPGHRGDIRGRGMPQELAHRYGGPIEVGLRSDRPTIIANFVSTLDGIVAFGRGDLKGGALISGFHEPDRFVMGLLRTLADAVVVGAGTLRGSTDHRWTAQHIHPASAGASAQWRAAMGLAEQPTTVIVSASGDIPVDHAGLNDASVPVVIATTPRGADRLARAPLGEHVSVESIGDGSPLTGGDVMALGACIGARLLVCEGGPTLLGELVAADLVDELFLTVSPQLVGRGDPARLGLVEGVALAPSQARWHDLVSVRRSTSHLFLRYQSRSWHPRTEES